ncbi:Hypothetical protein POVR1_LOCUS62 [uncultured virus]|nr:Hypothetical protein POVR1_LOCUS62 [uncultured virus]
MDGVITVILNIPIADLGTPKIVALLKQIEEFKKPDQQPLREESESERMKRKGLEAKLQILNEQFKDHGAAFQVEIPGESVNDLEKRVKKSMEWAQRKISEEAAKKSTSSKGKDEILEKSSQRETSLGPNGLVDPLIQAALQAVTDHIFSRVDTCFDIPKTQLNALEVFSITIVRNLFKKPNETSSPNKETRTFNADWLSDFGFTESQIKLINSSLSAALSAFNEDEMERLLKFNDAFLKCFVPTNASTINNYIKVLKAAFTDPSMQTQSPLIAHIMLRYLLGLIS